MRAPALALARIARGGAIAGQRAQSTEATTQVGAHLERCGAVWGKAAAVPPVETSADSKTFSWRLELPPEILETFRQGEMIESQAFAIAPNSIARFQLYPKGDAGCKAKGMCSLWLLSDQDTLDGLRLRIGDTVRPAGHSEFCELADGVVDVGLELTTLLQPMPRPRVRQSLQLTGLQQADWRIYSLRDLYQHASVGGAGAELVTSPPFRFHHVLLGDMYLEMVLGLPYPTHCTFFFQCRVPTMQLRVSLQVGDFFKRSFVAAGRRTRVEDLREDNCLQVNLAAPGVLTAEGDLIIQCTLEEVISLPQNLHHMIPQLDARTKWPKRI
eukprot:NODE_12648_length_1212_cov_3.655300.p1 GENE.NODE_12648_length_1212_cov_3.655300~~NODE_12648_length_1212_cov_3.655300.p1  ORF type:complete len:363 (+),score=126.82 NODE_12648_length_1212_cov_3.655300:109-1089(+)